MHEPILIKFYTFVYDLRMNIKDDKPNPTDIKGDYYLWGLKIDTIYCKWICQEETVVDFFIHSAM